MGKVSKVRETITITTTEGEIVDLLMRLHDIPRGFGYESFKKTEGVVDEWKLVVCKESPLITPHRQEES